MAEVDDRVLSEQNAPGAVGFMLRAFASLGFDTHAILARAEPMLRKQVVEGAPAFLSQMYVMWEAALEVTGECGLGVRIGERVRPRHFALYGSLLESAGTLGESLVLGTRVLRLVANSIQLSLHSTGTRACVAVEPLYRTVPHRETVEYALAASLALGRALTGQRLVPLEVAFVHDKPHDTFHHERVFGAPLRFGAAQSAYFFDSAQLLLPIQTQDPERKAALAREAERMLARHDDPADLQRAVRFAIERELGRSDASHRRIAASLGLHPKALARQLAAQGLGYRELVEQVRYELAERHLRRPEARVGQVALLLGYSEKSAFNRAFKRWAGCSPLEYRKRLGL